METKLIFKRILFPFFLLLIYQTAKSQVSSFIDIAYHTVDTVNQNLLSLDVYIPDVDGPKPIVIYVHGGGWVSGDKSVFGEKMKLFTDLGYIFASINYRLSPLPYELDNPDRVKYPQHPDDVARAVSFILNGAVANGGDLENVAIIGHSAGAQIVSLVMTDASFLAAYGHSPSEIKCLCSLDTGGYDLNLWLGSATDSTIALYTNAFSADSIILEKASPALNVDREDVLPNTLIVHQSTLKREFISGLFADSLAHYGARVKKISSDYSHGEINQKIGDFETDTSRLYTQEIVEWFEACFENTVSTDQTADLDIQVYPNPASELFYLSKQAKYQLIDLTGRVLVVGEGREINLNEVSSGIYVLALKIGDERVMERVFVE